METLGDTMFASGALRLAFEKATTEGKITKLDLAEKS
jgi:hypothetical protein